MAFTKKTWIDRLTEFPTRRTLTKTNGSTEVVTVARNEGTVTKAGDAFNASTMNDLENRIESGFSGSGIVTTYSSITDLYGKFYRASTATTITLTSGATIGQEFEVMRDTDAVIYIEADTGVTIKTAAGAATKVSITSQYGTIAIKHIDAAVWLICGDVSIEVIA